MRKCIFGIVFVFSLLFVSSVSLFSYTQGECDRAAESAEIDAAQVVLDEAACFVCLSEVGGTALPVYGGVIYLILVKIIPGYAQSYVLCSNYTATTSYFSHASAMWICNHVNGESGPTPDE